MIDFTLPPQLEATMPAELRGHGRDDVRMLVSYREGDRMIHAHFRELPVFLKPGDLVVLNTTATLPSALTAVRKNGDIIDLHVSTQHVGQASACPVGLKPDLHVVEPRRVEVHEGEQLALFGGARATLLTPYRDSKRLWIAKFSTDVRKLLLEFGRPITYSYVKQQFPIDAYQTVFAREPGSAEMPSAGRAFTREMLVCLRRSGVRLAKLVLHAGVASLENHERPYEEWYEVPARTAELVRRTRDEGGRVIAVGTTVVRALESSVDAAGHVIASTGWTDLVITPERGVRVVDGLLTGLHEPRATHLAMLEAIAGHDVIARAYAEAIESEYLWHEFGDVHLIL